MKTTHELLTQAVLNIADEIEIPNGYSPDKEEILSYLRPSVTPSSGDYILEDENHYLNIRNHDDIKYFFRWAKTPSVKKIINDFCDEHEENSAKVIFQVLAKAIRSRVNRWNDEVEIEIRIKPNDFQISKILRVAENRLIKFILHDGLKGKLLNSGNVFLLAESTEELRDYLEDYYPI